MANNYLTEIDLSEFAHRQLKEVATLIKKFATVCEANRTIRGWHAYCTDGLKVGLNHHSGNIFLYHQDCSHALMLNDNNKLETFASCSYCGHEDWFREMKFSSRDGHCINCRP